MTELIRLWIIGITCAAMIAAILQALLPKGGVGRVGRLVGGLLLMLATVQPLVGLDYDSLAQSLMDIRLTQSGLSDELTEQNSRLLKEIIESQTEAYILDKAEELGLQCQISVIYEWVEEGTPYPKQVEVTGEMTQAQRQQLSYFLEADLGVPPECQQYKGEVE